jgi:hypothetical protein
MRKIEVEEANVTVFGVYVETLHASGSRHLTDMSRRLKQTSDALIVLTGLHAAWFTSEQGNANTCFKNINSVGSRLRAAVTVGVSEPGAQRLTGRAQFCPPYQITFSPRR